MSAPTLARPVRDALREAYADEMMLAFWQAESVTHGYMVNPAGKRLGIDGMDLYNVGRKAHPRHASQELIEAWDHGFCPRPVSFAAWRDAQTANMSQDVGVTDTQSAWVDLAAFADLAGIKHASMHVYRTRGILPEPEIMAGRSPVWSRATAEAWVAARPQRFRAGWNK